MLREKFPRNLKFFILKAEKKLFLRQKLMKHAASYNGAFSVRDAKSVLYEEDGRVGHRLDPYKERVLVEE